MPISNSAMTDKNGSANVGEIVGDKIHDYIVKVSDEQGLIENALVTLVAADDTVMVCLPEGKVIDYYNRTTVKLTKADGTPIENWKITVYNKDGSGIRTELTDENGIVIVPPLSEAPIAKPTPTPKPDNSPLPGVSPSPEPTDTPNTSESPIPTDKPSETDKPTESDKPSASDKPSESPTPSPNPSETEKPAEPTTTPDLGDGAVVQNKNYKYRVYVWDNDGVLNDFGLIKLYDDGNLTIELPASKTLDPKNRTNVKVISEADSEPVKGITVTVSDNTGTTASDITNSHGIATVPVSDTDITDINGNAQVQDDNGNIYNINVSTEKKGNIEGAAVKITDGRLFVILPDGTVIDYLDRTTVAVTDKDSKPVSAMSVNVKDNKGGDRTEATDKDGKAIVPPLSEAYTDENGNAKVNEYTVIVEDTKAKIKNAFVRIADRKLSIKLPDTNELTTSNQTTVTVLDKDAKPVKDLTVSVSDKNNKTAEKNTDSNGKITVPVKTSTGGGGGSSSGGSGGGYVKPSYIVKVVDKNGKTVNVNKTVEDDKITLTLPSGKTLDDNYYTITVTDNKGKTTSNIDVTLKDKDNSVNGKTDANGQVVMPLLEHKAYIVGYPDGTFGAEGNMSRAEAAAIFARLIAEAKGEKITGKSSFKDVKSDAWHYSYIAYLEEYDVLNGYEDKTFRPDSPVSRAEFVAISVRYYKLFNDVKDVANTTKYTDINSSYWAIKDISVAKSIDWLNGYADGTFRGDNNITRAEAVTVINRATNRKADIEYVKSNFTKLNRFTDINDNNYWAFADIMEAANTHKAAISSDTETWVK